MSDPSASQNQNNELQDISVSGTSNTITFAPVQNTTIATQILQISAQEITQRELIWRSPYQGLRRFNTRDRDRFFGRDKLIQTILEAINSNQLTLVTGASGSGKSSVVRAGAIPELRKSLGNQPFDDFIFTPGEDPFASLYRCLLNEEKDYQFSESEAKIALQPEAGTLPKVVKQLKPQQDRWLWFIDQFEELFTNCGEEQIRQQFLQGLARVIAHADDSLRVVLGMRADFQESFSYYQDWSQLINQNSYLFVGEMNPEELQQAIEQPAAQHGVIFEEGLVKQIIDDVQGQKGYLPLLQYTLDLLWKQECETQNQRGEAHIADRVLNWQTYQDLQGVRGALKTQVEQIYQQMSWEQQEATKSILLKLVNIVPSEGGDRVVSRKAHRDEFAQGTTRDTLQQLIDRNLLVSSLEYQDRETSASVSPGMAAERSRQQTAIVELAHEILLVSWDRLKQWIEQEKEAIALKNFLTDETQRWQRVQQERGEQAAREELLQGTRLDQIKELRQAGAFEQLGGLGELEAQFVDASLAEGERKAKQARQRRRNIALGLGTFSGIALLLASVAGWAVQQQRKAEKESIVSQAQAAHALYLSGTGNKVEALINSLKAYQKVQNNPWLMSNNMFQIFQNLTLFLYHSQSQVVNNTTFKKHKDAINHIAFHPNNNTIASASEDKRVKLWNRQGEVLQTLQHENPVQQVAWSPKGDTIASVSAQQVKLWNRQGEVLQTLQHENPVQQVAWSPKGDTIASVSAQQVILWNRQGKQRQTLQHENPVQQVAWSPKDDTIASVSAQQVILWNRQGKQRQTLEHDTDVESILFSPNGEIFASITDYESTTSTDPDFLGLVPVLSKNVVRLRDRQGELLQTLEHEANITQVAFSPNGNIVASASTDGTIKLWNRQGNLLQVVEHKEPPEGWKKVYQVAFSSDGNTIASISGDKQVKLWSRQGKWLQPLQHRKYIKHVTFSPDGNTIASASVNQQVKLWNRQGELLHTLSHEGPVYRVVFSPDGNTIASASEDQQVKLWNRQGKLLHTLPHEESVHHVAFSPEGNAIATASRNHTVKLWNRQGELQNTIPHQDLIEWVTFSPDGQTIATGGWNNTVKLWNRQGELLHTLSHEDGIYQVTFSPDGKAIASASDDNTVKLWNRQGKLLHTFPHEAPVYHVAFSPNGKTIASASLDGTVKVWNRQGQHLHTLGHKGQVYYVAFSPDGNTIASASGDNTMKLWSRQGQLLHTLQFEDRVIQVAFSPDGNTIASALQKDMVHLLEGWKTGDELIEQGCQWLQNYVHPKRWEDLTICKPSQSEASN